MMFNLLQKPSTYYGYNRGDMLQYIPEGITKMLEVGCGEGAFGSCCREKWDIEVWGIELDAGPAAIAAGRLQQVRVGNIETDVLDLPANYFDCVVFNDVLEHLHYPWTVLRKIKNNLKRGGYVVASIPNIRYYECVKRLVLGREWEYESAGIMDITHLRFFTVKSIRRMFEDAGYCVEALEGIRYEDFPWKFNLLNRLLGNRLDDMRYKQFACVARSEELT